MEDMTNRLRKRPYVIAEIGGNHGGDVELAKEMINAAANAGADAVKFQTYITERFLVPTEPSFQDFENEALSYGEFEALATCARNAGVAFLSTPFDEESATFLHRLDVPFMKIASGDITHFPLLRHVAGLGRPILLSTGASSYREIDEALSAISGVGDVPVVIMHCVAAYPVPNEEANLLEIVRLKERYGCNVGFSDHTVGITLSLAAVALGATYLEKHFTTDQSLPGGDNSMSIMPEELRMLVVESGKIADACACGERKMQNSEEKIVDFIRRSLVFCREKRRGERIDSGDIICLRPGHGISPGDLEKVIGRELACDVKQYDMVRSEILK